MAVFFWADNAGFTSILTLVDIDLHKMSNDKRIGKPYAYDAKHKNGNSLQCSSRRIFGS